MDISEQSVKEHYGELIGIGAKWEVNRVEVHHLERRLEAWVQWKKGEVLHCPECRQQCPGYDTLKSRTWRHLDACGYTTVLHARMPRCVCKEHKVLSIVPSWAEPGSRFTLAFECHAIDVLDSARSVSAACRLLGIDWDTAFLIQKRGVERGLAKRTAQATDYLGMDEKSFGKGQSYGTVISDLTHGSVLEVMQNRDQASATRALRALPDEMLKRVKAVAMDMWKGFANAVAEVLPEAVIVHDRFHIKGYLTKAVDGVRRSENKELQARGDTSLVGSKYQWLRNPVNHTDESWESFEVLLERNLKTGRAWALKETFDQFWDYRSEEKAAEFFKQWFGRAKRSQLEPVKKAADTLKRHLPNILTYFTHRITNATAEGLNSLIQAIKSNARGFRNFANYRIAILFHLGKLDKKPTATHIFA
jgi:transposase